MDDILDFIEDITNRNILLRKSLELKAKEKMNIREKIDIMRDFERLKGQSQAFKMIVDFIKTKKIIKEE